MEVQLHLFKNMAENKLTSTVFSSEKKKYLQYQS